MRASKLWLVPVAVAVALPALAQDMVAAPVPATPTPTPTPTPSTSPASSTPTATQARRPTSAGPSLDSETGIAEIGADELVPYVPPVELPEHARRDPWVVGRLDPVQ